MLAQIGVMLSYVWPWLADVGAMLRPGQAILGLYDCPFGLCWAQVETMLGYVGATYSKLHTRHKWPFRLGGSDIFRFYWPLLDTAGAVL